MIGNKYDSGDYRGVYRAIIEADNRLLPNDVKINYNMEISLLNMHINEFERDIANGKPFNECLGMFQAWISDFKRFAFEPKPKSCHKCGGTSIWICSTYEGKIQKHAYELGLCVECGCVLHTLFGCQNNTCEWHDNCVECGSELCLDINGGCCYKCDKEIDQEEANLAFEFFGDDSSR